MRCRQVLVLLLALSRAIDTRGSAHEQDINIPLAQQLQHKAQGGSDCPRLAAFTASTALPALRRLVSETAFFRYYRFRLCDACATEGFEKGTCASPECAVRLRR